MLLLKCSISVAEGGGACSGAGVAMVLVSMRTKSPKKRRARSPGACPLAIYENLVRIEDGRG